MHFWFLKMMLKIGDTAPSITNRTLEVQHLQPFYLNAPPTRTVFLFLGEFELAGSTVFLLSFKEENLAKSDS